MPPPKMQAPVIVPLKTGRVSYDDPNRTAGIQTVLAPNDFESQWRTLQMESATLDKVPVETLLQMLVTLSPELSKGRWDFLRFTNPGWRFRALTLDTGQPYPEAEAVILEWIGRLREAYGSPDVQLVRLFDNAWLRGGIFAELVLSADGAIDLAVPDALTARYRPAQDPARGQVWELGQQVGGQFQSLADRPTVRYIPIDPYPGQPYGTPMVAPAVFACTFLLAVLRDLRRVIQMHGYAIRDVKVLTEVLGAQMPDDVAADPKKIKEWFDTALAGIANFLARLEPDTAFVHTDAIESSVAPGTAENLTGIGRVLEHVDLMAVRALKSMPMLLGITDGVSEANANRQWEMHDAGIQSVQHHAEALLGLFGEYACQARGIQARVEWRFAQVRGSEELRDEQVLEKRSQNALFDELAGFITHDEAARRAVGHEPAAPAPILIPKQYVSPTAQKAGQDPTSSSGGDSPGSGGTKQRAQVDALVDDVYTRVLDGLGALEASAARNGH